MLSNKVDKETVTNALHKKVGKTELSTVQQELEAKITSVEELFKSKLEQVLSAQEHVLKIIENENEIYNKKLDRHNPQLEDIRKRLDMKVDRREIDIFTKECINNVDRIRDDIDEVIEKLVKNIEHHKNNTSKKAFVNKSVGNDYEVLKKQVESQIIKAKESLVGKHDELKHELTESYENLKKDSKRQYEHLKEDQTDLNIKLDNVTKEKSLEGSLIERVVKLEVIADTTKEDIKKVRER